MSMYTRVGNVQKDLAREIKHTYGSNIRLDFKDFQSGHLISISF